MRNPISRFQVLFTAKIGRCTTCMRRSLAAALAMWAVFGLGVLMWPGGLVLDLIGLSAAGLTALWILHVATYAARAAAEAGRHDELALAQRTANTALVRTKPGAGSIGRRNALGVMLRATGVGVVVSAPLLWPSLAFAFCGACTKNADCGVGWVCRNTAAVNSGKICNECVQG